VDGYFLIILQSNGLDVVRNVFNTGVF